MSYDMMIGYDIYDCFTMEHFRLRQKMTLTTKIYCSQLYVATKSTYAISTYECNPISKNKLLFNNLILPSEIVSFVRLL
jgi:hypothetical protein